MAVCILRRQSIEWASLDHVDDTWLELESISNSHTGSSGDVVAGWDRELANGLLSHMCRVGCACGSKLQCSWHRPLPVDRLLTDSPSEQRLRSPNNKVDRGK